jgi:hypothetical protein
VFSSHANTKAACWKYVGFLYANEQCESPIDSSRIFCRVCLDEQKTGGFHLSKVANFSLGTSTGNINRHLLDKHEIAVESSIAGTPLILNYLSKHCSSSGSSVDATCATEHEINRDILIWFVRDMMAFDNVEKPGFVDFFGKHLSMVNLPKSQTLSGTALNDVYIAVSSKVKDELCDVQSICVMADGWTDRYRGRSYVGIRVSFIKNWTYRLVTLSCQNMCGSHTGQALADHIKGVLSKFFRDPKKLLLTTCHDGASNMMKASQLLKSQSVQHCVAHALHLLINCDSLNRVLEIKLLVQQCRDIVTALHFKSGMLEDEETTAADLVVLEEIRSKIQRTQMILDVDDQFGLADINDDEDMGSTSPDESLHGQTRTTHRHSYLKGSCPTRWNSVLAMIESITDLYKSTENCLKKIGRLDLCLNSSQLDILKELCVFLKEFEKLTLVVSTNVPVLSMIPLMKLRIKRICQIGPDDDDAIKEVKKLIAQNVDRRLPENDFVSINQVLDPLTKNVVPQEVGLSLLSKAFSIAADKGIITMTTTTTNIDSANRDTGNSAGAQAAASRGPDDHDDDNDAPAVSKMCCNCCLY